MNDRWGNRRLARLGGNTARRLRPRHDNPVFIVGTCHRTGSTLLQRLVSTIPDCFIWGESHGAATTMLESRATLLDWSARHSGARHEIQQHGSLAFAANASPDEQRIDHAYRHFFRRLWRRDIDGRVVTYWGYKEVRHTATHVQQLLDLFPRSRVLALNRQLDQVVESLLRWEINGAVEWQPQWTMDALESWRINTVKMPTVRSDRLLLLTYDQLVNQPEQTLTTIESHLGVAAGAIDRSVLDVRIHRDGQQGRSAIRPVVGDIRPEVRQFMAAEETQAAVDAYRRLWR